MPKIPVAQRSVQASPGQFQPGQNIDLPEDTYGKELTGLVGDFVGEMDKVVEEGESMRAAVNQTKVDALGDLIKKQQKQKFGENAFDVQEVGVNELVGSKEFQEAVKGLENTRSAKTKARGILGLFGTKENLGSVLGGHQAKEAMSVKKAAGEMRIKTLSERVESTATGQDMVRAGNSLYQVTFDYLKSVPGYGDEAAHLGAARKVSASMRTSIRSMLAQKRPEEALAMYQWAMIKNSDYQLPGEEGEAATKMSAKMRKEIQAGLKGLDEKELHNEVQIDSISRYINDSGWPLDQKIKKQRELTRNSVTAVRRAVERNIRAHEQATQMAKDAAWNTGVSTAINKVRQDYTEGKYTSILEAFPKGLLADISAEQYGQLSELERRISADTPAFEAKYTDYMLKYKDKPGVLLSYMSTESGYVDVLTKVGKNRAGALIQFLKGEMGKDKPSFGTYTTEDEIQLVESLTQRSFGDQEGISESRMKKRRADIFIHFNKNKTKFLEISKKKKLTRKEAEQIADLLSDFVKAGYNENSWTARSQRFFLQQGGEGVIQQGLSGAGFKETSKYIDQRFGVPGPPLDLEREEIPFRFFNQTPGGTTPQASGGTPPNTTTQELPETDWRTKVSQRAVNAYLRKNGLRSAFVQDTTLLRQLAAALKSGDKARIRLIGSRLRRKK